MVHGLNLDWKRFVTDQTIDFYQHEIKPLKQENPNLPAFTNFMDLFEGLDYAKFAKELDFVSWDSYPTWHIEGDDRDRKSTRLNSSHVATSYAVFCLTQKNHT